jgi:hypothetical protein
LRRQFYEYYRSIPSAAEPTITMASTLEAEVPHNNFDVRTATTPPKPSNLSLETRFVFALHDLRLNILVGVEKLGHIR